MVENTRSAGVVVAAKSKVRTVNWGCCSTSLTRHKDRKRVSVEVVVGVGDKIVVEVAERKVSKVAAGVERVEVALHRIDSACVEGSTSYTDSGKVAVAGVGTW